ncbi:MAG TPA: hypothetical protein VH914_13920 [Acidimicrobiia bacterium]|nr:hypothetical protein [Acidimicrobiia bacterium]
MADGSPVEIALEDDPTPLVRILGATLRRSARRPELESRMTKMRGVVALRSTVDPQAVTMRFANGKVLVEHGVATDSGVVIEADLLRLNDPDAPKPKVSGAARHPLLALAAAKVLDPPAGPWPEEARAFWEFARNHPRMPKAMLVVGTDDNSRLTLGDTPPEYELYGTAHALTSVFSGGSVLGQDMLDGKLFGVGSLQHLAELTGRSIAWMLGG